MNSTTEFPTQWASAQYDADETGRGRHGRRGPGCGPHAARPDGPGHGGRRGDSQRRLRHGGFGPESFGPRGGRGGFGPAGPRGFGPGGFGPGGPRGPRGRRARKGDVRAAILSLLAQQPANGYALIQAIGEQSNGAWRPSPGSVYPTLAQLVDEGLITPVDTVAPRSDYRLTEVGQAYVTEHAEELAATWKSLSDDRNTGPVGATGELFEATQKLLGVLRQYATEATEDQQRAAAAKLNELRREFYRTLGE